MTLQKMRLLTILLPAIFGCAALIFSGSCSQPTPPVASPPTADQHAETEPAPAPPETPQAVASQVDSDTNDKVTATKLPDGWRIRGAAKVWSAAPTIINGKEHETWEVMFFGSEQEKSLDGL